MNIRNKSHGQPKSLDFLGGLLPGGWDELRSRQRGLALSARRLLCEVIGRDAPTPDDMVGFMAAVPIPGEWNQAPGAWAMDTDPLQDRLWVNHRVEVPISAWPAAPHRVLRASAAAYNREEDYQLLADALGTELAAEGLPLPSGG